MESEESKILDYISKISSPNESIRQEASQYLQSCTFQIQYLPFFENTLHQCITGSSRANVYYCMLALRDIILNRGCILSDKDHINHVQKLLTIANDAAASISNDIAILNVFSDAISISYRFIFEKGQFQFLQTIFDFYKSSIYHKMIATCTLISIINAIENHLSHQTKIQHKNLMKDFANKISLENQSFYDLAFQSLSTSPSIHPDANPNLIKGLNILGIELLSKATQLDWENIKSFHIKDHFFKITNKTEPPSLFYIDCLFNFFNVYEPKYSIKALECIRCYLWICHSKNIFNSNIEDFYNTILYIIQKTNQTLSELVKIPNNGNYNADGYDKRNILPLLLKIAEIMTSDTFILNVKNLTPFIRVSDNENERQAGEGMQILLEFLGCSIDYTKCFILSDPFEFFKFWSSIAKVPFDGENKQKLVEVGQQIFAYYLKYILTSSDENLERAANDCFSWSYLLPSSDRADFIHGVLWESVIDCIYQSSSLITDRINQIIEEGNQKELDSSFSYPYLQMIVLTTHFTYFVFDYSELVKLYKIPVQTTPSKDMKIAEDNKKYSLKHKKDIPKMQFFLPQNNINSFNLNDLTRSFQDAFVAIIKFIQWESENLSDRLNIIGENMARFECCAAALFRSFLSFKDNYRNNSQMKNLVKSIEDKILVSNYPKETKIVHFFIDHFVEVIKTFGSYSDLLFYIFDIFEDIGKKNSTILTSNQKLIELSRNQIQPFNFESIPINRLKKAIPMMYKIYSAVNSNELTTFLSSFNNLFSPELINPEKCFLLYSQLCGIIQYSLQTNKEVVISQTFKWMIENHFEDTIKSIQTHCKNKTIISIIIKTWLSMSGVNYYRKHLSRTTKKSIQIYRNGDGIEYFKKNTIILMTLKECCEDSQWISMKVIHNCIYGDYSNYGIMEHFKDNSLQIILENFFFLLCNWAIGENSKRLILITEILQMLPKIEEDFHITQVLFSVEQNFQFVHEFLIQNLLISNGDTREKELWGKTCDCLYNIIKDAIHKSVDVQRFAQFFIVVLDKLITSSSFEDSSFRKSTTYLTFIFMKHIPAFCHKVMERVISTFEKMYIEKVGTIFNYLWELLPTENDDFTPSRNFDEKVEKFSNEMKTYQVEVANIPEFQPFFRRVLQ